MTASARAGMEPSMAERMRRPKLPVKGHEKLRIAGQQVDGEERIEVRNPYTGALVATVAAGSSAQVAEAFRKHIDPQRLVILRAGDFRK